MRAYARCEALPLGETQQFRKLADAVKGVVGRLALFVKGLHGKIDIYQKLLVCIGGQPHHL